MSICSCQSKWNYKHLSEMMKKGESGGFECLKRGTKQPQENQFRKRQANTVSAITVLNTNTQGRNPQVSNIGKGLKMAQDLVHTHECCSGLSQSSACPTWPPALSAHPLPCKGPLVFFPGAVLTWKFSQLSWFACLLSPVISLLRETAWVCV